MSKKQSWQDQAREIESWQTLNQSSIRETAEEFGWSNGNVCEMLNLAAAMRCYPDMEKITTKTEAIKFMKNKEFRRKFDD